MQISDSVVAISGASSGLGAACVSRWLAQGAAVVGIDIVPPLENWQDRYPNQYLHAIANVTSGDQLAEAIAQGRQRFGRLNGAICCAGVLLGERVLGRGGPANLEAFRRVIEVNLVGTFNLARLAAEAIASGEPVGPDHERGVIVMTASIAAYDGQLGQAAYSASKGGVAAMTLPMARELARVGIRVISLAPGVFNTPMMQAATDKVRQPLLDQTLFPKRFGDPDEFAAAAQHAFENSMLNATVWRLDAGLRM